MSFTDRIVPISSLVFKSQRGKTYSPGDNYGTRK